MSFWIYAALMCVAAAAFLIVPGFIRRTGADGDRREANLVIYDERVAEYSQQLSDGEITQAEYEVFLLELKRNLLSETGTEQEAASKDAGRIPLVCAIIVPLFALFAYSDFGLSWGRINDVALAESIQQQSPHDQDAMAANVDTLAERLQNQPDNHEGWYMLGRSYLAMGKFEEAADAFAHMLETFTDDHSLHAYWAEALYMSDDRVVTPRVAAAIEKTLALNPHDITMLEIKALGQFQRQELRAAIMTFQKALASGAEGERADMINRAIVRIQEDLGDAPMMTDAPLQADADQPPAAESTSAPGNQTTAGRSLQVLVEVADTVNMPASTPVFVFARAVSGPPMPLAVQRLTKAGLPTLITLDESMAMMQGMGLANFDTVQVVARISASGIANAGPDDYQALSGPIDLTKKTDVIKLQIEKQVKDF
jgi:cytochrome c-type biogenesis protein CcmH